MKWKDCEPTVLLGLAIVLLALSAFHAHDLFTWFLEILPILIAVPLLVVTYRRFRLTPLLYQLIFLHALILMVGGHYTYAEVPLGYWIQDLFGFARNHYDRLGHFAQGFVPAILAREVLLRCTPLQPGKMMFFLVTAVCLAVSATYELFEWVMALATGEAADAFLGTQGDIWDTQWDMFFALVGALSSQLLLASVHDRQIAKLRQATSP
jgi:putative membrane protein